MEVLFWVATLGGIGYLPISGFLAMILGLLWMYVLERKTKYWIWILFIQFILSIIVISLAPLRGVIDPSEFILDEFVAAGILLLGSRKWYFLLVGLVIFSILDSLKPVAQYFEHLPGGLGIVGDDIISAILATMSIFLLKYIALLYLRHTPIKTNKKN